MKYADGVSRGGGMEQWITMPRNEKLHKGGKQKETSERGIERGKNEKNCTAWQAEERKKRQQKGDARQEGGDSSGKTCRRTTMYNEMPTKADTSSRKQEQKESEGEGNDVGK